MEAFEAVYLAYFSDVYAYALKLCGNKTLAEDLTSDTFLKAMDKMHTFRGEAPLRVWLCSIARNQFYSHMRRQGKILLVDDLPDAASDADTAQQAIDRDQGRQAMQTLATLPEIPKRVFLLRALGGLPFARIGQLFNRSENWACVTYHRARRSLRDKMKKEE